MSSSNASDPLYHIVSKRDWQAQRSESKYTPESLAKDGFIHFSSKDQLIGTANAFFKGQKDLLVLELEIPVTDKHLKWESAVGPEGRPGQFPHYYSPLSLKAIKKVYSFEPMSNGSFSFPTKVVDR